MLSVETLGWSRTGLAIYDIWNFLVGLEPKKAGF